MFLFGFAKNDRASLSAAELAEFRELGAAILKASAAEIERAVASKKFLEVKDDEGL